MDEKEKNFLERLVNLKTPEFRESPCNYNDEYDGFCGDYCNIRNLAKDCLKGLIPLKTAKAQIDIFLKRYDLKPENELG